MSRSLGSKNHTIRLLFGLTILIVVCANVFAQEENVEKRPLLDLTGNRVFSKPELLEIVDSRLDNWTKNGSKYNVQMLDYCLHQMDQFMTSHGYLQAHVIKGDTEQTEAGPRVALKVVEGPLYRVGKISVDGARLLTSEEVVEAIGMKPGDVANGQKLSDGLFDRLKTRYAKVGYVQYMADVNPTFRLETGAPEGVVDFALTIDEGEQFRIHSIKIVGADVSSIDFLKRELLLRDGDIFDDELLHESINRMNRTGLVEPIDAEKDVNFTDLKDQARRLAFKRKVEPDETLPPLLDLVITVKKATSPAAPDRN